MRKIIVFGLLLLFLSSIQIVSAQTNPSPRIINFDADIESVTPDEAESGTFPMTLTWQTENLRATDSLQLYVYVLNEWINALEPQDYPLPANGSREHIVPHTLDFSAPRLRLLIFDENGVLLNLYELVIPYENPTDSAEIIAFNTDVQNLSSSALINRTGNVPVSWEVVNRPTNSNLVFEQIYDDGRAVNVEYPRDNLWIRSSGEGAVRPALPDGDTVRLRLSLRDVFDDVVYAYEDIEIPVITPPPPPVVDNPAELVFFEANTLNARVGDTVTLSWASRYAQRAFIEVITFVPCCGGAGGTQINEVYRDLPANGSLQVVVPDSGSAVTYQLILDTYEPFDQRGPSATVTVNLSTNSIVTVSGAYQLFENGFMLWQGDSGTVWVLLNDGRMFSFVHDAYARLPDNPITDTPPENRVAPIRGFGRVWGNFENIRVALGWGLGLEQGYSMTIERVAPVAGGAMNFLISLPDGRVVLIRDTGYWSFQPVP